jgi:hypothetical protein
MAAINIGYPIIRFGTTDAGNLRGRDSRCAPSPDHFSLDKGHVEYTNTRLKKCHRHPWESRLDIVQLACLSQDDDVSFGEEESPNNSLPVAMMCDLSQYF